MLKLKTLDAFDKIQAKQDKRLKFTSLIYLINAENLAKCYKELKRNKACGIDQVTVETYGENLEEKLKALVDSMKRKQYQPQPVRRVYIPKAGSGEKRGLGILSTEDKLVQIMLKKILENIYEADFLDSSYGFRPGRNCHQAIKVLDKAVMYKPINYIVEVDIKKFFDNVRHKWLMRCLRERIADPNVLWLVKRFLKAGIIEIGHYKATDQGTPQGGIVSPILANIYLHYVLDLWFEKKFKTQIKGYTELIRFCDDFVVCCESEEDAKKFLELLKQRLSKFGLEVSESKTKVVKFGRKEWHQAIREKRKTESFDFLGFTHYGGKSRKGRLIMGHKTSKINLARKLKEIKEWIKTVRNRARLKDWWQKLKVKLIGHYNYFGISGNYQGLMQYYWPITKLAFKWVNRRSQKKSMDWKQFNYYFLGSVDKILEKPYKSSNKIEKTHKNLSSLVKSRKNAPKVLDFSKEAFNQMTFFVDMLIVIPLYFSIPFWWNNYYTSLAFKTCNKSITIVAFISHYSRVIDIFG